MGLGWREDARPDGARPNFSFFFTCCLGGREEGEREESVWERDLGAETPNVTAGPGQMSP